MTAIALPDARQHFHRRMQPLLGTYVEIGASFAAAPNASANAEADRLRLDPIISQAFTVIAALQRRLSFHDSASELAQLNAAGGAPVSLHYSSVAVLRLAMVMMRASHGLFNCTVGGSMQRHGVLPGSPGSPASDVGCVDDIQLLPGCRVALRRDVRITLDGIAKGYAVDCAVRCLQRAGVGAGWVNAGGDLRVFGAVALPIQRRDGDGGLTALAGLHNMALASSHTGGEPDPRFPGRIVDAHGRMSDAGLCMVLARHAWRADALTKVVALVPAAERAATVARLGGEWLAAES